MAQTAEGAVKIAAQKAGVSERVYRGHVSAGLKWCFRCRSWHPRSEFGRDRTRYDGLTASCRDSRNADGRGRYTPIESPRRGGPPPAPARNGDVLQARHSVNLLVRSGRLPRPNDLPCYDCGHVWSAGERRHEYDHYLGYAAEHHLTVQAVCTTCHRERETRKG